MIIEQVRNLKPGESIRFKDCDLLIDTTLRSFTYNGAVFTAADRVLENIVSSSYEYGYRVDEINRAIEFFRLEEPLEDGSQSYVSPDRRHLFNFDGRIYHRKQ